MNLTSTSKGMIKGVAIISAVGLAGVFFVPHPLFYAIGLALGAVVSVVKIILLELSINRALKKQQKLGAGGTVVVGYTLRYMLTGLSMLAAWFFLDFSGLIGAFAGALALAFSAYIARLFFKEDNDVKFIKQDGNDVVEKNIE